MPVCAPRLIATTMTLLAGMILAGCTTPKNTTSAEETKEAEAEKPRDVASVVREKMPASVKDRDAWAQDIATTFSSQSIAPTLENICSVLAVAQQESNYQADPQVPGLNKIAWKEIDRRAARYISHLPWYIPRWKN